MEGKCRHYLFCCSSVQFLFAEEYSKPNGNPSFNFDGRNTWKYTILWIYVKQTLLYLGGLVVDCNACYPRVTGSIHLHISTSLILNLCLTITLPPPPPASNCQKINDDLCLLFCLLVFFMESNRNRFMSIFIHEDEYLILQSWLHNPQ